MECIPTESVVEIKFLGNRTEQRVIIKYRINCEWQSLPRSIRNFELFKTFFTNSRFSDYLHRTYPNELEVKDTTDTQRFASCLDLHLEIDNGGRLNFSNSQLLIQQ